MAFGRLSRLLSCAKLVSPLVPGCALDLACGDGRTAVWLANQGWHVTGVDFSAQALNIAARRTVNGSGAVSWTEADVRDWEPGSTFDLVFVGYLHLPADENRAVLRRAASWVNPTGRLLIVGHDLANVAAGGSGPHDPDVLYTPTLLAEVASGLQIVRLDQVHRRAGSDPEQRDAHDRDGIDIVLYAVPAEDAPSGDSSCVSSSFTTEEASDPDRHNRSHSGKVHDAVRPSKC